MLKDIRTHFRVAFATVLFCVTSLISVRAQSPEGWMHDNASGSGTETLVGSPSGTGQSLTVGEGFVPPPPPPLQAFAAFLSGSSAAPDEITPEISALTRSVINGQGG
jgi:hypothetical protein